MEDCLAVILSYTDVPTVCCYNQLSHRSHNDTVFRLAYQQFYGDSGMIKFNHGSWYHLFKRCYQLTVLKNFKPLAHIDIASMYQLKHLDFAAMQITILPSAIGQLYHLETLNCSCNQITELPASIGK